MCGSKKAASPPPMNQTHFGAFRRRLGARDGRGGQVGTPSAVARLGLLRSVVRDFLDRRFRAMVSARPERVNAARATGWGAWGATARRRDLAGWGDGGQGFGEGRRQDARGARGEQENRKRAVLYARVSTDEQAKKGYSLTQQLEALREYASREGYEVLEEVTDGGRSGASLARPGLDHVRDLVAAGGVEVVLAQDRDRFGRKVVLNGLLEEELSKHGCRTKALNDYGDDSPEGALMRGIQTQFAEYERTKIAERTRRGKERKAREGKVLRGPKPPYGFRYNAAGDGLVVEDPEMAVIERIFRVAAGGLGPQAIRTRLHDEGTPSPTGGPVWPRRTLEQMLRGDLYKACTREELAGLVSAEVLASLDEDAEYGVWWFGRKSTTERAISEPDGNGGAAIGRPRPPASGRKGSARRCRFTPASRAGSWTRRAALAANRLTERKRLARGRELRGLLRRSCGWKMTTHTAPSRGNGADYHYYLGKQRKERRQACDCEQRTVRAAEGRVWAFVAGLLRDPERVRRGIERLVDEERTRGARNPEREAGEWAERIAACDRRRGAYQDQQAAGLMTLDELGSKLRELDNTRRAAERELASPKDRRMRAEGLENDQDALLLDSVAEMVPEALDGLTGEEKNRIYRMLRLEVAPRPEGYDVSGALCAGATPSG